MFRGSRLTSLPPYRGLPDGLRARLLAPDDGAPSGGSQPNTPPPATERPGTTPGGTGGAGGTTPPPGGNPAQPQPGSSSGTSNPPAPGAGNNQQAQPWTPRTPEEIEGVNQYVQARLAEEETRRTNEANRLSAQQEEADKLAQGKFRDVAEQRGIRITELEGQLASEMRKRIAASHNLPTDAADRLVGADRSGAYRGRQEARSHAEAGDRSQQ